MHKSMGSRYAVNKFMRAAHVHGLDYEIVPSSSKFFFHVLILKTTTVHQALEFWFPTKPPMFRLVDIVEQGRVPILFSLQQMKNLRMQLDMRLDRVLISCEALGLHCVQATQASSSHIVIDLVAIRRIPPRIISTSERYFPCFVAGYFTVANKETRKVILSCRENAGWYPMNGN